MTTDEIKKRCEQFTEEESSDYDCRQFSLSAIESLYREAMAAGLEMAAAIAQSRAGDLTSEQCDGCGNYDDVALAASNDEAREIAKLVRAEITKLKEPPCDTSDLDRW